MWLRWNYFSHLIYNCSSQFPPPGWISVVARNLRTGTPTDRQKSGMFFLCANHPSQTNRGCKYCRRTKKQNDTASARCSGCATRYCGRRTKTKQFCGKRENVAGARLSGFSTRVTHRAFQQQTFLVSPLRNLEAALGEKRFPISTASFMGCMVSGFRQSNF